MTAFLILVHRYVERSSQYFHIHIPCLHDKRGHLDVTVPLENRPSPVNCTRRSLPTKWAGYFNSEALFNQISVPSSSTIFLFWPPFGIRNVCHSDILESADKEYFKLPSSLIFKVSVPVIFKQVSFRPCNTTCCPVSVINTARIPPCSLRAIATCFTSG